MKTLVTNIGDVGFWVSSSGRMTTPSGSRFSTSSSHRLLLPLVMAIFLCFGFASSSQAQEADQQKKLESLLQRFPDADADKDGKLTEDEARQYATKRRGKAKAKALPTDSALPVADLRDEKYGPHERNVLDFWFAKNTNAAAPLIVFIHGGGFVGGDKSKNLSPTALREALDDSWQS